jgi:peptidoglycan/LPS O-acetylase OafA/YrhL
VRSGSGTEDIVEKRLVVAIAALCLALLVAAQAALFVYVDSQSWWPWNGFWMVLTGVLVLVVVATAGQGRDQVAVRNEVPCDDRHGDEPR